MGLKMTTHSQGMSHISAEVTFHSQVTIKRNSEIYVRESPVNLQTSILE